MNADNSILHKSKKLVKLIFFHQVIVTQLPVIQQQMKDTYK